jgi:GNAT superfamily N-acetyltransferase
METRDADEVTILIRELGYNREYAGVVEWIEAMRTRQETQIAFVVCLADQVIGWIEVSVEQRLQTPPFALIGGLVVKDGYRNRQVGLRLCERAEAWTWEQGLDILRVTSRSSRTDAHRFYLRNGYTPSKVSHVFEKKRPE